MARFEPAYEKTLGREGGYSALPGDSGNWACGSLVGTNYGISAPVLQTYLNRCPTAAEMANLPISVAKDIYKRDFWDVVRGDEIKNQSVAELIFDTKVLQGNKIATFLSKALNENVSLPLSENDVDKINKADQSQLFNNILQQRVDHLAGIGGQFVNGWMNRLRTFSFIPSKVLVNGNNFERSGGMAIAMGLSIFGLFLVSYYFLNLRIKSSRE